MTATSSSAPVAPGCPVSHDFDPFGPTYQADPARALQEARASHPVFYSTVLDCYVVTRWADIRDVLKDNHSFSTAGNGEPLTPLPPAALEVLARRWVRSNEGARVRRQPPPRAPPQGTAATVPARRRVSRWSPASATVVTGYLDGFVARGTADLVAELFAEAPAVVALEFMGVPQEDVATVKRFAEGTLAFLFGRPSPEEQVEACDADGPPPGLRPRLDPPPPGRPQRTGPACLTQCAPPARIPSCSARSG